MENKEIKDTRVGENEVDTTSPETPQKIGGGLDYLTKEAYNLLRANLMFSLPDKQGGKIIGFTSSNPQEGKSYTAINLSYALAEAGYKVILLDADMRRPSIHATLGKPLSPGLSNLLIGESKNVMRNGVLHENLSVIMAGDIPPNPSELIGSARMQGYLDTFAKSYDYVIVDLPPVNYVSDPLAISKCLDGIVLVVKHAKTRCSEVTEAVRQLKFTHTRILGIVYNGYRNSGRAFTGIHAKFYGQYGQYGQPRED